ncbi:MAG: tetratricopeptide repeat protein [bacterium]
MANEARSRFYRTPFDANRRLAGFLLLALAAGLLGGCDIFSHDKIRLGIGGHYNEAQEQFLKGKTGNMDKALVALNEVVTDDPTYKDSLTLLGRAYYNKGQYEFSRQVLQRALRVNNDDEVAWMTLGMTQLQLGDDDKGMQTLQGAITLLSKASKAGYRGYSDWDSKGLVRSYISRTVIEVRKGVEAKPSLLRTCETLLARMDDEQYFQKTVGASLRQRQDTR